MPYRVTLLGPIAVTRDGADLPLTGTIPRAIIARLALTPRRSVRADDLIESLWKERTPAVASSLRAHISRLKAAGLDDLIHGGRGGYSLELADDEVDVLEFRQLINDQGGDTSLDERLERLARADRLWHGEPMEALDGIPFIPLERERLWRERRTAVMARATLILESSQSLEIVESLESLLLRDPLDEQATLLLAQSRSRMGRTREALAILDEYTLALRTAVGIEASALVTDLRQSIIRFDTAVSPTVRPFDPEIDRSGLPLPLTTFIGRQHELAAITRARTRSRLITLVGPGGTGKSRTAIESARRATWADDHEQWLLDLSLVERSGDVIGALARLVGANGSSVEASAARLGSRRALLIVDNAEHVLDAVADLCARLLAMAAGLTIIVTSRSPLGLSGERIISIPPMSPTDAEMLLTERAHDVDAALAADPATSSAVRTICSRLDRLPLALELAAARLDSLEPQQLLESIEQEGPLGVDHARGRRRSLAATIGWSVDLLNDAERSLLRELPLFTGLFTEEAVEATCQDCDGGVRIVLASLIRQSLVSVELIGGVRHFRLLESVRAFVAATLPQLSDAAKARWAQRHLTWYSHWIETHDVALRSEESSRGHAIVEAARGELRAALLTAIATDNRDAALRIAGGQAWHLFRRGGLVEGREAIDRALRIPGSADPAVEARALFGALMLIYRLAEPTAGRAYAEAGLPLAIASGDVDLLALFWACNAMWTAIDGDARGFDDKMSRATEQLDRASFWVAAEVYLFKATALGYLDRVGSTLEALDDAEEASTMAKHGWAANAAAERAAHLLIRLHRGEDALRRLVGSVRRAAMDKDMIGLLAHLNTAAGACTLLEHYEDGAVILGAIDATTERLGYDPSWVAPHNTAAYRIRVRSGLTPDLWTEYTERGRRMPLADVVRLIDDLVVPAA